MCPHTTICVLILLCMCPHTAVGASCIADPSFGAKHYGFILGTYKKQFAFGVGAGDNTGFATQFTCFTGTLLVVQIYKY